jgi:hypothetical protein
MPRLFGSNKAVGDMRQVPVDGKKAQYTRGMWKALNKQAGVRRIIPWWCRLSWFEIISAIIVFMAICAGVI